jgi:hypothetical protein
MKIIRGMEATIRRRRPARVRSRREHEAIRYSGDDLVDYLKTLHAYEMLDLAGYGRADAAGRERHPTSSPCRHGTTIESLREVASRAAARLLRRESCTLEWDAADHGSALVASGAASSNPPYGPPWEAARSRTSQATGLRTIEISIDALDSASHDRTGERAGFGGGVARGRYNSVGYWSNGNTRFNGTWGMWCPALGQGDIVGVQVDFRREP